LTDTGENSDWT